MEVEAVDTLGPRRILPALRRVLDEAEDALLCTAFVSGTGVQLIRRSLERLGARARLLVTTQFGSTEAGALNDAAALGVDVRVLNLGTGTYHPKLYLGASPTGAAAALVGSANLTRGLVANVESGLVLRGPRSLDALEAAWTLGERLWADPRVVRWMPVANAEPERLTPDLAQQVADAVARSQDFPTLGPKPRPNRVVAATPEGVFVETERSARRGAPQRVPAWMIQVAYDELRLQGTLDNRRLLADDGLGVKRSSFVCALLARLPGVEVVPGRVITLRWVGGGARPYSLGALPNPRAAEGPPTQGPSE